MAGLLDDLLAPNNVLGATGAKPRQTVPYGKWVGDKLIDKNGKVVMQAPSFNEAAQAINSFMPITGDIQSGLLAASDVKQGNYGSAALNGLGLLPFIPSMGGMIKGQFGRIAENGFDSSKLAKMLITSGEEKGYNVLHENSAISPSQYLTFSNNDGLTRQVRISNHADKYPELASGKRYSTDPSTENTFENSVNWLAKEGFPTSLSSKYENIPSYEDFLASQAALRNTPDVKLRNLQDAWLNKPKATRGAYPTIEDAKKLLGIK